MRPMAQAVRYRGAVILMGVSGLVAEMILLREFLIIAAGNEMTIGIILANWLIIEAAGAALGGRLGERFLGRKAFFVLSTGLFCLFLPPTLYLIRILKPTLGLSVGEAPGLPLLFISSFLIMLPTSLAHGAQFPGACGAVPRSDSFRESAVAGVYLLDTAGTLAGGVIWTWLLIPHFHSFEIALGAVVLNGAVCLSLLLDGDRPRRRAGPLSATGRGLSILLLLGGAGMLITGGADTLHHGSIARQWRGQNVVDYRNSVHGNICVVENEGQFSFFIDGTLALITPFPEAAQVKTYAHIPLTAHPDPRQVLLIGGGPGGLIREMLRHPGIRRIDYAELDPLLIEMLRRHSTSLTEAELSSPRLSVRLADGRTHLLRSREQYDVILSASGSPSNLETNRFFTREFFQLAARRLSAEGILVLKLPALLGLQNQELANLTSSLYSSLASVFPQVRLFPGEDGTMAIASGSSGILSYDVKLLVDRLEERDLLGDLELPWEIERRLHPGWQASFLNLIEGGGGRENRDFAPRGVFLSLAYWNTLHAPELVPLFRLLRKSRPWMVAAAFLPFALIIVAVRLSRRDERGLLVAPAVFGTGFAGMLFALALSFSFQSLFGYLFSWIGLLTAVFMGGVATGALLMSRHLVGTVGVRGEMIYSELAVLLTALLLPVMVPGIGLILEQTEAVALIRLLFLFLPFICGVVTGAQFPLAARLRQEVTGRIGNTGGDIYAADLMGGWLGGMLGGVLLLPVLGLGGTGVSVALLKLLTLALFSFSMLKMEP